MWMAGALALWMAWSAAQTPAGQAGPPCANPSGRFSQAELQVLFRQVSEADRTLTEAGQQIVACGVRFTTKVTINDVPPTLYGIVQREAARYQTAEQAAFNAASARRLAEYWQRYLQAFPDGPRDAEVRAEAARAASFASLIASPPIRTGVSEGLNQVELSLLRVWRDGDTVRAFYRVRALQDGLYDYVGEDSSLLGWVGYDDSGHAIRAKSAFVTNRFGEHITPLAAAANDVFYLDVFMTGAALDARTVTLLRHPFVRRDNALIQAAQRRRFPIVPLNWSVNIADGTPSNGPALSPIAEIRAAVEAGPMAEWRCADQCTTRSAYFHEYAGEFMLLPGAPRGLGSIRVRFFGAVHLTAETLTHTLLVYELTNDHSAAQLLQPRYTINQFSTPKRPGNKPAFTTVSDRLDDRFLIKGSDDVQRPVIATWYGLLDDRFRPAGFLWLAPGKRAFAALELSGIDVAAAEVSLRGRFLVNYTDSMRLRLPSR
jgi:hypothetical protein